jgi:uncharacterized membrane protein (DUF4010 family)
MFYGTNYFSYSAPSLSMAMSGVLASDGRMLPTMEWPYPEILIRLTLGLALGLLIGIERERRHKEAGLRTFGLVALLGAIGGALGEHFALMSLLLTGLLIVFLNLQTLHTLKTTELTTSAALLVTCFAGILCGQGHTLTPAAAIVITAALLTWKQPMAGFTMGLTEKELHSALTLAILAIVIYPALPEGAIGSHGFIVPRQAWLTVLLISGIAFVNYVLWKIYGARGSELASFLGGLVNSRVAIVEITSRANETQNQVLDVGYRGILLATAAMLIRNALVLGILAPAALISAGFAFISMLVVCAIFLFSSFRRSKTLVLTPESTPFPLELPFSLWAALKYGSLFVFLQIIANLAQMTGGEGAFYLVSFLGGFASSASSLAAAANLAANGVVPPETAGLGAVIATVTSVLVNLPFVLRSRHKILTIRVTIALVIVASVGILGGLTTLMLPTEWAAHFLTAFAR